jgi:trehalose 6-phosphate phosphatase
MTSIPPLPPPERAAFLLDFDGTLVDIAPSPEAVIVPPGLTAALAQLRQRCGGALAIVSGRPIAQIEAFLGAAPHAIAGEHGTAIRPSPESAITYLDLPQTPQSWRDAAASLVRSTPGLLLEAKRYGFVVHFRAVPTASDRVKAALEEMLGRNPPGYAIDAAKMAWELRPTGADKGSSVRALMRQAPFAGRVPIFIGDDATDEDGMRAARRLGGLGLRVDTYFGEAANVRAWIAGLAEGRGW